jgi:hypothetical protein
MVWTEKIRIETRKGLYTMDDAARTRKWIESKRGGPMPRSTVPEKNKGSSMTARLSCESSLANIARRKGGKGISDGHHKVN